jgi:hypothetical protein
MTTPEDTKDMRSLIEESVTEIAGDEPEVEETQAEPEEDSHLVDEIRKEFKIEPDAEPEPAKAKTEEPAEPKPEAEPKPASSLSDEDRKVLETLAPEAKAVVDRLSADSGTMGDIRKVFEPFADAVKQSGMNEVQIIKGWADLYKFAQTDPVGYAKHMLKSLNLDPATLADKPAEQQAAPEDDDDPFTDEETKELRRKVKELTEAQQQSPQAIERAKWETRIEMFSTAKDAAGNLLHPHFNDVQREIGIVAARMRADGEAVDLAKAYAEACRINPEISARVEADKKKQAEEAEKRKTAHERQKRAASSIKSDGEAIDKPPRFEDLDLRKQLGTVAAAHGVRQL